MVRKVSIAARLAPLLFMAAGNAQASNLCDRLFERLADMPQVTSNGDRPVELMGALSRQNIDLRRARSDRRALGCSGGSITVVNGDNEEACADIDNRIARLETEIETLKARRLQQVAGSGDDAVRRRVVVALKANRCEEDDGSVVSISVGEPETHRNIIADLPPIGSEDLTLRGSADVPVIDFRGTADTGPLRTLCVRTCDGSFFPISSDASPADFARDEEACQRRCPGATTELYYHALTTEESDRMVSAVTGKPYTDLPTAFAYKSSDPANRSQCGCRPVPQAGQNMSVPADKGVVTIRTLPAEPPTGAAPPTAAAPARPAPAAPTAPPAIVTQERPYDPGASRVRQVGPTFLPAEESAIDLRHPAGPAFQPQQQTN